MKGSDAVTFVELGDAFADGVDVAGYVVAGVHRWDLALQVEGDFPLLVGMALVLCSYSSFLAGLGSATRGNRRCSSVLAALSSKTSRYRSFDPDRYTRMSESL